MKTKLLKSYAPLPAALGVLFLSNLYFFCHFPTPAML